MTLSRRDLDSSNFARYEFKFSSRSGRSPLSPRRKEPRASRICRILSKILVKTSSTSSSSRRFEIAARKSSISFLETTMSFAAFKSFSASSIMPSNFPSSRSVSALASSNSFRREDKAFSSSFSPFRAVPFSIFPRHSLILAFNFSSCPDGPALFAPSSFLLRAMSADFLERYSYNRSFNSSRSLEAISNFSAWTFKNFRCGWISFCKEATCCMFSSAYSSFRSASARFIWKILSPSASSIISRRSLGEAYKILSASPCPMIWCWEEPKPTRAKSSIMFFKRTCEPFKR